MQPINQAERNNAFFNFLLFFIFTVIIIVVIIFFSVKVPFEENDRMRQKMLQLQSEKALTDSFTTAMKIAMNEISKFNSTTESPQATKQRVQYKIDDMSELIKNLPDQDNSIYGLTIQNLTELNEAKKKVRELENKVTMVQNP